MKIEKITNPDEFKPFKIEITIESLREIECLFSCLNVPLSDVNETRPSGLYRDVEYNIREFSGAEEQIMLVNFCKGIRDIYEELIK